MAAFAAHSQEAVLKATALEVILNLLFNIPRQKDFLRFKMKFERRVIFFNDLIKEGVP